jgi:hypothetical protein
MSLYEDDKHGFVDMIKVRCSSVGCEEVTKAFCPNCKKWFCKQHISNHIELQ